MHYFETQNWPLCNTGLLHIPTNRNPMARFPPLLFLWFKCRQHSIMEIVEDKQDTGHFSITFKFLFGHQSLVDCWWHGPVGYCSYQKLIFFDTSVSITHKSNSGERKGNATQWVFPYFFKGRYIHTQAHITCFKSWNQ